MPVDFEHEHAFFCHEDPRYLICRCGQYAVRTRTDHGESSLRLIDPPTPVVLVRQRRDDCTDVTETRPAREASTL